MAVFDTSINWDYPSVPSPWSVEQWQHWRQAGGELLTRLRTEQDCGFDGVVGLIR